MPLRRPSSPGPLGLSRQALERLGVTLLLVGALLNALATHLESSAPPARLAAPSAPR